MFNGEGMFDWDFASMFVTSFFSYCWLLVEKILQHSLKNLVIHVIFTHIHGRSRPFWPSPNIQVTFLRIFEMIQVPIIIEFLPLSTTGKVLLMANPARVDLVARCWGCHALATPQRRCGLWRDERREPSAISLGEEKSDILFQSQPKK